jgi:hypothetical protein
MKTSLRIANALFMASMLSFSVATAFAQSESNAPTSTHSNPAPFTGVGLIFVIWYCVSSRDKPVGGWLRFFILQCWIGGGITVFSEGKQLLQLIEKPGDFTAGTWLLFIIVTALTLLSAGAMVVSALMLDFVKVINASRWAERLRTVLFAYLFCLIMNVAIELAYKSETWFLDLIPALFIGLVVIPYFFFSERVKALHIDDQFTEGGIADHSEAIRPPLIMSTPVVDAQNFVTTSSKLKSWCARVTQNIRSMFGPK